MFQFTARASEEVTVSQSLGVLLGVGAVILLFGVALGIMVGIFCYKSRRQQDKMRGLHNKLAGLNKRFTRPKLNNSDSNKPLVVFVDWRFIDTIRLLLSHSQSSKMKSEV